MIERGDETEKASPMKSKTARSGSQSMSRRKFLKRGIGAASTSVLTAASVSGSFSALLNRTAAAQPATDIGYGELVEIFDDNTGLPLLKLPEGFHYVSFGWTDDPLQDGVPTPGRHDGMGVVLTRGDHAVLVRNHELPVVDLSFAKSSLTYDPVATGGTTSLTFHMRSGRWEKSWVSLGGTSANCAGGITPWNSWLSCEETMFGPDTTPQEGFLRTHGWVFEVPALRRAAPEPLTAMGRFVHEAVAVDPVSGYVYETEDMPFCGFYRFVPLKYGRLSMGGTLQMLKVVDEWNSDLTGRISEITVGTQYSVEWIDIADPEVLFGVSVLEQGLDQGGAMFARLEGCWHHGGSIFIVSTDGGLAGEGLIWQYDPREFTLTLIFASPDEIVLNNPDNITVSPSGGIMLCEDGGGILEAGIGERMVYLTPNGGAFPFAENNVILHGEVNGFEGDFRGGEWAGATFSPDGRWLFANISSPGFTVAITGPWHRCSAPLSSGRLRRRNQDDCFTDPGRKTGQGNNAVNPPVSTK